MTAHCMAVNKTKCQRQCRRHDQYVDADKHTWTTDGFLKTVDALYNGGYENVAAIYCSGQGGDQGTRAIINNMYGGTFTDAAHTKYTADSPENVKAIQALYDAGRRQLRRFHQRRRGDHPVPQRHVADGILLEHRTAAELRQQRRRSDQQRRRDLPMAFPTESGDPKLCGGIWGFGIFDNGDEAKIAAAKTFIDFIAADPDQAGARPFKASTYFPVREERPWLTSTPATTVMSEYHQAHVLTWATTTRSLPAGPTARTAWWNMLQQRRRPALPVDHRRCRPSCTTANAAAAG